MPVLDLDLHPNPNRKIRVRVRVRPAPTGPANGYDLPHSLLHSLIGLILGTHIVAHAVHLAPPCVLVISSVIGIRSHRRLLGHNDFHSGLFEQHARFRFQLVRDQYVDLIQLGESSK